MFIETKIGFIIIQHFIYCKIACIILILLFFYLTILTKNVYVVCKKKEEENCYVF